MSEHRPRHTILKLLRAIIRAWPEMTPALPSPEPGAYVVGVPSSKPPVPASVQGRLTLPRRGRAGRGAAMPR